MLQKRYRYWLLILPLIILYSCSSGRYTVRGRAPVSKVRGAYAGRRVPTPTTTSSAMSSARDAALKTANTGAAPYLRSNIILKKQQPEISVDTKNVLPKQVVDFAEIQIGVPYRYGGINPQKGFDCSGFINYVFDHFGINVPRITYLFTNAGVEVPIEDSRPGDLVLFTGSNVNSGIVGHMGIITKSNNGDIQFIHASSSRGIMISAMDAYFTPRFVKINRIFN